MRIDLVSIFPDYFAALQLSLVGKAIESGLVDLGVHDLRDWTHDRHRTVDDTPYGGGAGMVMKPEPWGEALDALVPDADVPVLVGPLPPVNGSPNGLPRSLPPRNGCCSPADATRASMLALRSTPAGECRCAR